MDPGLLTLSRCLGIGQPGIVALYGAGGKTTLLNHLASELAMAGQKVILTTTTRVYRPSGIPLLLEQNPEKAISALLRILKKDRQVALGKGELPGNKIEGIKAPLVERLFRETGAFILVEADGASGKPLKGHAVHEPVLPAASDLIIPVAGVDALGEALNSQAVHRPELFARATGAQPEQALTEEHLARYMGHAVSRGRWQAPQARIAPVFNKLDCIDGPAAGTALSIAAALAAELPCGVERVVFTSFRKGPPVRFTFNLREGKAIPSVACVVLAAGTSSRMGEDKLALPLDGQSVLEHTLQQVVAAVDGEVVAVVQPESAWPDRLQAIPGCRVVVNPRYREGISASLKAGLAALQAQAQAVMFVLADQPLISPAVYRAVLEGYRSDLKLAACPVHDGKRGNPVIFDRRAWPLLMQLEGDCGGRKILPLLPAGEITYVDIPADAILRDLDTPADYRTILAKWGEVKR